MRNDSRNLRLRKKRRTLKKKVKMFIILPLLLLILSGFSYAYYLYVKAENAANQSYEKIDHKSKYRDSDVKVGEDNISILFIGVDESEIRSSKNSGARSDALMLATLNEKDNSITLLNIPRDSYVYFPFKGTFDKITHAHAYEGVIGTVETVEELLEIPIDYYVKMNFHAFIDIVDALGGIEVKVPYEVVELDSNDRRSIHLKPGLQTLNGEESLALARTRRLDSDIERGKRQQEIMKAIFKKATSVSAFTKYGDLIDAVGKNMTTDLSFSELKALMNYFSVTSGVEIDSLQLKGSDSYINGVYYYQLDEQHLSEIKQSLKQHLELEK